MKRTFPANIDGQIFYIDEDAFELLRNYLDQLRAVFRGSEGQEIISDIESRIRELFAERISAGANVIVLADVNNVIATMGRPEDLGEESQEQGSPLPPPADNDTARPFISINLPGRKRLFGNMRNNIFGGFIGGLATYLGWNASIMRLLFVILMFFPPIFVPDFIPWGWTLFFLYLLAWMIIPAAVSPQQILEQNGRPVNVDTVGQAVMATSAAAQEAGNQTDSPAGSFLSTFFTALGKLIMIFFGLISGSVAIGSLIGFIGIVASMIAYTFVGYAGFFEMFEFTPFYIGWPAVWSVALLLLSMVAIFGLMTWGALAVVFDFRGASKFTAWTTVIISVMLLIAAGVLALIAISI